MKIRAEINAIETKTNKQTNKQTKKPKNKKQKQKNKKTEQINETRSWFFGRINKIDKPLASLIKKKKERTQILKSRMKEERSQPKQQKYKQ